MSMEQRLLIEWQRYTAKRPRRVVSANSANYPALSWLYRHAQGIRGQRPRAKQFTYEGVRYAVVWLGLRMCVMHVRSGRVLVGAAGAST